MSRIPLLERSVDVMLIGSDSLPEGDLAGDKVANIPVLRPFLPRADRLLPYLLRIDEARIYTNYGPLVAELETRLANQFRLPEGSIVSASSGTAALVGSILASVGRATAERPFILMPTFTFVATAVAVEQCGYRVWLTDVDPVSWMLEPAHVLKHPAVGEIAAVIPVAPFGRPVPQGPWQEVREKTGIPVIIDAAASFETISEDPERFLGDIPVALSFHATKSFTTAEGGCVVTTNLDLARRVSQALNFGFHETRDSRTASTNGKMSEYHAAIGLAEIDEWPGKRASFQTVADEYRRQLTGAGIEDRFLAAPEICSSYALFRCRDVRESERVQEALRLSGVEYRFWYGTGVHGQSYYSDCRRDSLEITEEIGACVIGLPVAPDLSSAMITRVVEAVVRGLAGHP